MKMGYIGIDQYGTHYKIDKYPHKELLEQTGYVSASNMYVDTKDGKNKRIGYVLTLKGNNALWISVYEVHEWTK